ncbi:MAG: hypothetical protein WCJ30_23715 [Deltaproteobacteria bacterium]
MTRPMLLVTMGSLLLRVCGHAENQPVNMAAAPPVGLAMAPEHGGALAVSAGLVTEVSTLPDGRIVAYVRDANRAPVQPDEVDVSVRRPDGTLQPIAVAYDPQMQGYVGRPTGLVAGSYPVEVSVRAAPTAPAVQLVTPSIALMPTAIPAARYGGRVEVVGDQAVETVVARNGSVAMFWMDLNGNPIPASDVQVPTLTVTVNGAPHTVVPRVENDHFVAMVPAPPSATVSVATPGVVVRGVRFRRVYAPVTPVIAVMPPGVYLAAPSAVYVAPPVAPAVYVEGPAAPAVYIAPPTAPTVYVAPPVVGGVFIGEREHGHGHGRGEWRNGGVLIGGPGVYVAPRGHGGVFVGGGGGWGGGRGHGRGH